MSAPLPDARHPERRYWRAMRWLTAGLLLLWLIAGFGLPYLARQLSDDFFGWTFGFWWAAQGALLSFVALVFLYQWAAGRLDERYRHEGD